MSSFRKNKALTACTGIISLVGRRRACLPSLKRSEAWRKLIEGPFARNTHVGNRGDRSTWTWARSTASRLVTAPILIRLIFLNIWGLSLSAAIDVTVPTCWHDFGNTVVSRVEINNYVSTIEHMLTLNWPVWESNWVPIRTVSNSEDYHGEIQSLDREMSANPDPQNIFWVVLQNCSYPHSNDRKSCPSFS